MIMELFMRVNIGMYFRICIIAGDLLKDVIMSWQKKLQRIGAIL